MLLSQPYNLEHEQSRKAGMDRYYQRSKHDEKNDLLITAQAREIEAVQRKRKAEAKKRKSAEGEDEVVPGGMAMLRSNMLTRSSEQLNAKRWLFGTGLQLNVHTEKIQNVFDTLCADVSELIDWQKRVTRKRRERDQLAARRAELLRPGKKPPPPSY